MATYELPLFPLHTVLFPHGALPVHVFEPRYREMIGRCLEDEIEFGVVLIRSGSEVGPPAEPYRYGTTARIRDVRRFADGRMLIEAVGVSRFRLLECDARSHPYLVGRVELLPEPVGDPAEARRLGVRAQRLFLRFFRLLPPALREAESPPAGLPDDPCELSYVVASALHTGNRDKQQLLELPTAAERLAWEIGLLHRQVEALRRRLEPT